MKIVQIISQDKSIMGLGDDGKLYRFDYSIGVWVSMQPDEEVVTEDEPA